MRIASIALGFIFRPSFFLMLHAVVYHGVNVINIYVLFSNHCVYPINTGKLERGNNKIKVIKRKSYGFHDLRYFTLKIYQNYSQVQSLNLTIFNLYY